MIVVTRQDRSGETLEKQIIYCCFIQKLSFLVGFVLPALLFMRMFCRPLFVLLSFSFCPLCCLSFNLRILITPLVSSNSSYAYFKVLFKLFFS